MIEITYIRTNAFGKRVMVTDRADIGTEKDIDRAVDMAFGKFCESRYNRVRVLSNDPIVFSWKDEDTFKKDMVLLSMKSKRYLFDRTRAINFAKQYAREAIKKGYNITFNTN